MTNKQNPLFVPDNPALMIPHRHGCVCVRCENEKESVTPSPYAIKFHGFKLDPYRIFDLYGVTDGPTQHAIKKLLCAGRRGAKTKKQDIQEAIQSLQRGLEMMEEDSK